jgi:methionine-rich copper-binding protein CopC
MQRVSSLIGLSAVVLMLLLFGAGAAETVTAEHGDAKILHVALKPLAAGRYKIAWRVTSVDSHTTNGTFMFRVAP